ncbi:group II truncated hemoglobin [Croceicoccus bisphenolivorans]|uniref:group II truncated hemoglobin n=1 Tax=Croceicoccus bisphenolivorans TaxID=1783232 RepID=UPI00083677CC|nr:group II truncated hemoglobin [Croceicoccus bisphenolivorans]
MATDETKPEARTPYDALGGAPAFRTIVDRFYDLMDSDPAYARLRDMHGTDLAPMRDALASFLGGWAGGPREWFEANPGRCMFSIHGGFPIDAETGGQWAEAMERAIADADIDDRALAGQLSERLSMMARGMARNAQDA